eukprot:c43237_g1_i1 orf=177-362(+)
MALSRKGCRKWRKEGDCPAMACKSYLLALFCSADQKREKRSSPFSVSLSVRSMLECVCVCV